MQKLMLSLRSTRRSTPSRSMSLGEEVYWEKVKNAAKAEIALRRVLKDENAVAFTTNFDDLGDADIDDPNFCGFDQIPGLASQRLMAEGYGFGAEVTGRQLASTAHSGL